MTTAISNNVIKISADGAISTPNNTSSEYPRTCDFCRDTYNSELTFTRHKETGKCFRFCKLLEEVPMKYRKSVKPRLYPRVCERCLKTYKNKHSYYKHKVRCWNTTALVEPLPSIQNQVADVDVVELSKDDIENIPITDNKENINDLDSKFILAIDVENECENYDRLYPRICEFCHKAFKCRTSFSNHRLQKHCSSVKQSAALARINLFLYKCEKCKKSFSLKNQLIAHTRRCGLPQLQVVPQLKKADDFQPHPTTGVQIEVKQIEIDPLSSLPSPESPSEPVQKKLVSSLYPRECKRCHRIYPRKQNFYRHKKWCCPDIEKPKSIYPRTCEFCGFTFVAKFSFHRHKNKCPGYSAKSESRSEKDGRAKCKSCDRIFENAILYRQHVKFVHPTASLPTYPRTCEKCGNTYLSRQAYCNHKRRGCFTTELKSENISVVKNSNPTVTLGHFINGQDSDGKDSSIYPRKCEFCKNIYVTKQSFYRHKETCLGYTDSHTLYPRVCEHCRRIYSTRQSFYGHKVRCTGRITGSLKQEIENENEMDFTDSTEATAEASPPNNKSMYPKMCMFCRKIYANRQTFCKHKSRCVPVPLIGEVNENPDQPVEQFTYPRECRNCLGTFKCAETFEAHKIRCDFFEPIDDSNVKMISQSNCEHCRNILSQYRRIFHEHLEQCTDRNISFRNHSKPRENRQKQEPPPPEEPQNSSASETMEFVDCTANFCECCGVFFDSIELLEEHKRSMEQVAYLSGEVDVIISDLNPNICDICREVFDTEEEYDNHRLKCVVNSGHKTYPRFCECCQKIFKTKQSFYNHKKNCHIYCFKYFVEKDCEVCLLPFKCEIKFLEHKNTCIRIENPPVETQGEVLLGH